MDIYFIEHAAILFDINQTKILINPMLNRVGSLLLVNQAGTNKNLSPLNTDISKLLTKLDAVIFTHTQNENLQNKAFSSFVNSVPIVIHPRNQDSFKSNGLNDVICIQENYAINNAEISKFGLDKKGLFSSNDVYGFLVKKPNEPVILLSCTDSWKPKIKNVINEIRPDISLFRISSNKTINSNTIAQIHKNEISEDFEDYMLLSFAMDTSAYCLLINKSLDINLKDNICKINIT